MGSFVLAADAVDNVAALERAAETCRAGADGETAHVKMLCDGLAFDKAEGDINVLRQPLLPVTVECRVRYLGQYFAKAIELINPEENKHLQAGAKVKFLKTAVHPLG